MNTEMVSSQGTSLDEAIKLSATYFDESKTSKLLILISDGEDHSEGPRQQQRKPIGRE
jgi:Ca-activated chloride channel family protein